VLLNDLQKQKQQQQQQHGNDAFLNWTSKFIRIDNCEDIGDLLLPITRYSELCILILKGFYFSLIEGFGHCVIRNRTTTTVKIFVRNKLPMLPKTCGSSTCF